VSRKPLRGVLVGLAVLALAAGGFAAVDAWTPPQDLPWKPLTLDQPIGLATHWKIARVSPARCRSILSAGGVVFRPARPFTQGGYCAVHDAGGLYGGLPPLSPGHPVMTCREALALSVWARQSAAPAARNLLGAELMGLDHFGTYACRDIRGGGLPGPSQHATANAIDISGFRLGDGRRITVAAHYHGADPRGAFLRKVRADACRVFSSSLGPDYNAAHHDHFHLDMGPWGTCR
jgi:hypothetical protein